MGSKEYKASTGNQVRKVTLEWVEYLAKMAQEAKRVMVEMLGAKERKVQRVAEA